MVRVCRRGLCWKARSGNIQKDSKVSRGKHGKLVHRKAIVRGRVLDSACFVRPPIACYLRKPPHVSLLQAGRGVQAEHDFNESKRGTAFEKWSNVGNETRPGWLPKCSC